MGDQKISELSGQSKANFLRHLLDDIEALEYMIENRWIETGVTRIGAEQEFCLIGDNMRPAMTGPIVLQSVDESHFTSELARWNLEINLDPQDCGPGCLTRMQQQLDSLLDLASNHAARQNSQVLLTGILPTIRKSDLNFDHMSPNPRYKVLDEALSSLRGEDFSLFIEGVDEINLKHSSILFEACNTSFQVHLQIEPDEFADRYNWAQVIAGPVLAACVNSPTLLGKELWSESRIALFRQSVEIRHAGNDINDRQPRVAFGYDWLDSSAVEIFKNDVAFYQLIIADELDSERSMDRVRRGEVPRLRAMNLHNGTLYKWNRACFGVGGDKPHLRIENRYLPSGPTPLDEMANSAFWIGLMMAMPDKCRGQWDRHFYFQDVRSNFLKAARNGLSNELVWFGKTVEAGQLVLDELIPAATQGLQQLGIPAGEYQPLLNVIEQRVRNRQTGAAWIIKSMRALRKKHSVDEAMLVITRYMAEKNLSQVPGHEWGLPAGTLLMEIPDCYDRVDSIMATNLVTVRENDLVDFAETLMHWRKFHHLPVENLQGEITGVITARDIERFRESGVDDPNALVETCMTSDILTVAPEASVDEAEQIMLNNDCGSLPVVRNKQVIGILTVSDIRRLRQKTRSE